jgi:hypothetical protein
MILAPMLSCFCLPRRNGIGLVYPRPKKDGRPKKTNNADAPTESDRLCPSLQITIIVSDESTAQSRGIPPTI